MTSTANSFECNYFRSHTLPVPCIFPNERAELVHINERISSLDRHISELNMLRRALQYRSCQLHNLLSPIQNLPFEVLSRIFQQTIICPQDSSRLFHRYHKCLSQAFILASVSAHFRHVALGTPELWRRIPLAIHRKVICQNTSLLQHCVALATSIKLSVFDQLNTEEARSAIEVLLAPETTQKIEAFELYGAPHAQNAWLRKLEDSPRPMLDTLSMKHPPVQGLDLGSFMTVTRLGLYDSHWSQPLKIIAPPSLQYITTIGVPQQVLVSLLYQCPNLVQCFAVGFTYFRVDDGVKFNEPLTLSHLKHLTLHNIRAITIPSSQNLQLPSLETLQLKYGHEIIGTTLFLRNVSATLTTLKIHMLSETIEQDYLYQLWKIPFPKLRELELRSGHEEPLLNAIQVLALRASESECSNTKHHYLPSLEALTLHCRLALEAHCLLDLLAKWKIGKASDFYVEVRGSYQKPLALSLDLRDELRSTVGSRRIEITWYGSKITAIVGNPNDGP